MRRGTTGSDGFFLSRRVLFLIIRMNSGGLRVARGGSGDQVRFPRARSWLIRCGQQQFTIFVGWHASSG